MFEWEVVICAVCSTSGRGVEVCEPEKEGGYVVSTRS